MDSQRGAVLPEEEELSARIAARIPMQDGEPAPEQQDLGTPDAASALIKSVAEELGADMVGISPVDPKYVYDGFEGLGGFAIVFAIAMDYEGEILKLPRQETNVEYIRVYELLSRLGVELAEWIRERGYAARAHTLRDEQLAMLPHAYTAGLGELGKHGSLINRELGCAFRIGIVTTELVSGRRDQRRDGRGPGDRALDRGHGAMRSVLQPPLRLRDLPGGLPDQREGLRRTVQGRLREADARARPQPARRAALRERDARLDGDRPAVVQVRRRARARRARCPRPAPGSSRRRSRAPSNCRRQTGRSRSRRSSRAPRAG